MKKQTEKIQQILFYGEPFLEHEMAFITQFTSKLWHIFLKPDIPGTTFRVFTLLYL